LYNNLLANHQIYVQSGPRIQRQWFRCNAIDW